MLVGNDIVDLHDPWSQPDRLHPRFDRRAFTLGERALIAASRSAHELRWSMWAAKESAFKVARKLDCAVRFLPRDFTVRLLGDAEAEVRHGTRRFSVCFEQAAEWLHALAVPVEGSDGWTALLAAGDAAAAASDGGGISGGADTRVDRLGQVRAPGGTHDECPSGRVRELARAAVGAVMGIPAAEIRVAMEGGIPALLRRGERLPVDLSLSHHGRFVACAWAPAGLPSV